MSENKKYEMLENDTITFEGKTLYRIRALKDFGYVSKGDEGGYVEKEYNLSQRGECWVYSSCKAIDNAKIIENAILEEECIARDNVFIGGNAYIRNGVEIRDNACIFRNCRIEGGVVIKDKACISDYATIWYGAKIGGTASVSGEAWVENCEINEGNIANGMFVNTDFEDIMFFSLADEVGNDITALKVQGKWLFNRHSECRGLLTKEELIDEILKNEYFGQKEKYLNILTLF